MNMLRSEGYEIYSVRVNKISLSLSFKAIRRRKRIDTFADGYRLTLAERYYYLMDLLEAEQR